MSADNQAAEEKFRALNFAKFYECTICTGKQSHWQHEKLPQVEIILKAKASTFCIYEKNFRIAGPHYVYQLSDILKKVFPNFDA